MINHVPLFVLLRVISKSLNSVLLCQKRMSHRISMIEHIMVYNRKNIYDKS